jgi:hypothetical protein
MPEHSASVVVAEYLTALAGSDLDGARELLGDDFTFRGPGMADALDRDTFMSQFGRKYDHVRGVRVRVLRQVESDGQVSSLYELDAETPHGATTFLMTEWNTVRDGRVRSALLVFDTADGARLHAHA